MQHQVEARQRAGLSQFIPRGPARSGQGVHAGEFLGWQQRSTPLNNPRPTEDGAPFLLEHFLELRGWLRLP